MHNDGIGIGAGAMLRQLLLYRYRSVASPMEKMEYCGANAIVEKMSLLPFD